MLQIPCLFLLHCSEKYVLAHGFVMYLKVSFSVLQSAF